MFNWLYHKRNWCREKTIGSFDGMQHQIVSPSCQSFGVYWDWGMTWMILGHTWWYHAVQCVWYWWLRTWRCPGGFAPSGSNWMHFPAYTGWGCAEHHCQHCNIDHWPSWWKETCFECWDYRDHQTRNFITDGDGVDSYDGRWHGRKVGHLAYHHLSQTARDKQCPQLSTCHQFSTEPSSDKDHFQLVPWPHNHDAVKVTCCASATVDLWLLAWLFMALDWSRFKSGTKSRRRHALLYLRTFSENKDVVNETEHTSWWPLLSMAVPSR